MQHSSSGRSLAVRVGALTAALSLMLAGGVAVATASSAAVHFDKGGNGNGGNSDNAPGQNKPDNGGGNGNAGGNGGNPNPGGGGGGGNGGTGGNGGVGDLTEKKIWVCHADTNNGNGQNNLGNNGQGGENKNGFNLIHISIAAWQNQHDRLHENDFTLTDEQVASGVTCGGGGSEPVPASLCLLATGEIVPFADNTSKAYTDALADTATYAKTCPPGGGGEPAKRSAQPSAPICVVVGEEYTGVTSVTVDVVEAEDASGNGDAAQAQADEQAEKALEAALVAKQQGNNIVPPWSGTYHSYAGYNWNDKTQARFAAGCSPNQSVISAVLPGTVAEKPAGGNPQPGKVGAPAAATMPGSVNAGGGSSAPAIPLWAFALVIVGALGAAASGAQLLGNRK